MHPLGASWPSADRRTDRHRDASGFVHAGRRRTLPRRSAVSHQRHRSARPAAARPTRRLGTADPASVGQAWREAWQAELLGLTRGAGRAAEASMAGQRARARERDRACPGARHRDGHHAGETCPRHCASPRRRQAAPEAGGWPRSCANTSSAPFATWQETRPPPRGCLASTERRSTGSWSNTGSRHARSLDDPEGFGAGSRWRGVESRAGPPRADARTRVVGRSDSGTHAERATRKRASWRVHSSRPTSGFILTPLASLASRPGPRLGAAHRQCATSTRSAWSSIHSPSRSGRFEEQTTAAQGATGPV